MAHNTRPILVDVNGKPIPQYFNAQQDQYEALLGQDGAARAILYGPNGQPITNENPLEVRARLLEELLGALNATKETNPDASTATLLALLRGLLASVGKEATLTAIKDSDGIKKIADAVTVSGLENLATAAKQDTIKDVLDTLATESTLTSILEKLADPATQTTLAQVLSALGALATETTLGGVKTAVDVLAGTVDTQAGVQKVTLTGSNLALRQAIVTGSKTVTSTAAEIFAGASRLDNRHAMVITNTGADIVYIGAVGVTTSNGFPIFPQDTLRIEFDPTSSVGVFACTGGPNVQVRVVELA